MREWRNRQTRTFEGRVVIPYGFKSHLSHQTKDDSSESSFVIQSEGLVCNRRKAYVITQSVYVITAGVFLLRIDYIPFCERITYIPTG